MLHHCVQSDRVPRYVERTALPALCMCTVLLSGTKAFSVSRDICAGCAQRPARRPARGAAARARRPPTPLTVTQSRTHPRPLSLIYGKVLPLSIRGG